MEYDIIYKQQEYKGVKATYKKYVDLNYTSFIVNNYDWHLTSDEKEAQKEITKSFEEINNKRAEYAYQPKGEVPDVKGPEIVENNNDCLLYTSPSPRDRG
eukprot:TRINITY_DN15806_c0_g1_i1.p6 TRINITY_DN15806_c0_g1~~TRINITY_DN15806_c0_g1_i1.p6  ORF type:complete len:100 (+),score=30.69 TRINITY_DN15806_c0_g1_i1:1034-1333(+)